MMTLVTGATGFLGRHLVKELHRQGRAVKCLVRKTSQTGFLAHLGVELVFGDLEDKDSLRGALQETDIVFNAAGEVFAQEVENYFTVNVTGVKNLLEACLNGSVRKFIHFSSSSATGPNSLINIAVHEDTPCCPITPYGKSKLEGEKIIKEFSKLHNLPIVIIRAPLVYGSDLSNSSRVLMFLQLINKGLFRIIGSGNNLISLCYIDNLIQGVLLAENEQRAEGQIYFLSDARSYTVNEIAEAIARELGKTIPDVHIPLWAAATLSVALALPAAVFGFTSPLTRNTVNEMKNSWHLDISKARRELGYAPTVTFEDGLKKTVEWFMNDYVPAHIR